MVSQTIKRFPAMAGSIDAVYMVEASKELTSAQKDLLCSPNASLAESGIDSGTIAKHIGKPIMWAETLKSVPVGWSFLVAAEACY